MLAVIAAAPLDRGVTAGLALVAVAALASRAVLSLADVRAALGPFAVSLDVTVELALALGAAWLTGGLRSPLLIVPAATLVVSRRFHGPAASRFQAVATVLGHAGAGRRPRPRCWTGRCVAAVRVLWPLGRPGRAGAGRARRAEGAAPREGAAAPAAGAAPGREPVAAAGTARGRPPCRGARAASRAAGDAPLRASASATCARRSSTTCARR